MKLILKKDVENLGDAGQVVSVKAGFGRNYLIPHGLAYVASEANMRRLEEEHAKAEERSRRDFLEARRRASQLEGMTLTFHERAGEDGKLFGSVSAADIAEQANTHGLDFELDKRAVDIEEAIKIIGVVNVPVRLHKDVDVEIEVRVEREEGWGVACARPCSRRPTCRVTSSGARSCPSSSRRTTSWSSTSAASRPPPTTS